MDIAATAASAVSLSQARIRQDVTMAALGRDAKAQTAVASLLEAAAKPTESGSGERGQNVNLRI